MSSESREPPPIPHIYLPRRSVYGGAVVLKQQAEGVLIVQRSIWSRGGSLALAAVIGGLCSVFLYWFCQPLLFEEVRVTQEDILIAGMASFGVLFSLALAFHALCKGPIRFDRVRGTVERGGWFPGGWKRDLADVLAVQICRGKSEIIEQESSPSKVVLQYQINLVFSDSPPSRRNLSEQKHHFQIRRMGREIAEFLDVPILNYVGPVGTFDAADAEARRLLARSNSEAADVK